MSVEIPISLTDDQAAYARGLVDRGQYPSLSAVFRDGLDMLRREHESHDEELRTLQLLIDQRRAGPFVDLDESGAAIRKMWALRRTP
ncbi:ribbon-helix-helix domain-containing protein [Inquilinus limosus]|mgnify:CR=1 FL=1|uniref:Uncharacterized protein n=1 Tax=Inquilinus limosus MP06 TaxID=1398085 RepID=A0A0A0DBZ7_9PROT|nr:hypothetical protein [Inquilinus limosus]KGM35550.1 hypothetical protein P409_03770 [Inquilinus limosus MP06]